MIGIVRGLAKFDGRSAFTTWAYRIATNAALDELRRRGRRPALHTVADEGPSSDIVDPTAERQVDAVVDRASLDAALAGLADDFRAAVVLRDVADLDYAEIAEVLDDPGRDRQVPHRARPGPARREPREPGHPRRTSNQGTAAHAPGTLDHERRTTPPRQRLSRRRPDRRGARACRGRPRGDGGRRAAGPAPARPSPPSSPPTGPGVTRRSTPPSECSTPRSRRGHSPAGDIAFRPPVGPLADAGRRRGRRGDPRRWHPRHAERRRRRRRQRRRWRDHGRGRRAAQRGGGPVRGRHRAAPQTSDSSSAARGRTGSGGDHGRRRDRGAGNVPSTCTRRRRVHIPGRAHRVRQRRARSRPQTDRRPLPSRRATRFVASGSARRPTWRTASTPRSRSSSPSGPARYVPWTRQPARSSSPRPRRSPPAVGSPSVCAATHAVTRTGRRDGH